MHKNSCFKSAKVKIYFNEARFQIGQGKIASACSARLDKRRSLLDNVLVLQVVWEQKWFYIVSESCSILKPQIQAKQTFLAAKNPLVKLLSANYLNAQDIFFNETCKKPLASIIFSKNKI
jgi:hypothetical protein